MLPHFEALARDRIEDLLDQAEHARLVARLRSLQRARRRDDKPTAATPASNKQQAAPATVPLHACKHGAAGDGRATVERHQPSAR
jgi:hypothetical protein